MAWQTRSSWYLRIRGQCSQKHRQECDRKNTKAKMVVKSVENRRGDQICSFCCYLLWSGTGEAEVKFCTYVK